MALVIEQKVIEEDILDTKGNKLGVIRFNPNDARIMNRLVKIINELEESLKKMNALGDFSELSKAKLETAEDFEKMSDTFKRMEEGLDIEEKSADMIFSNLGEIFGEDTIQVFTGGTKDIMSIMPLIEYIMPFVQKSRKKLVNKYINKKSSDVME